MDFSDRSTITDTSKRQKVVYGSRENGYFTVFFSEPGLELYADFDPAAPGSRPLDFFEIMGILEKNKVIYGILEDAIKNALEECNAGRYRLKDVLIAEGVAPEAEVAEVFELNPLFANINLKTDDETRIDHRKRSPFVIVNQGQVLAHLKPKISGKEGISIYGAPVPFNIIHPEGMTGGENTNTEGDKITAKTYGQLVESRKVLSVQENLVIKGGVGYQTGNIVFPGDVQINGPVSDGFKIYSGGSIEIKETLDLSEVVAKGDITINGGIIGKGPAFIKSGGGIRTRFIENCQVAARKSVQVETEIIHSSVYALDSVEMNDKGKIIGSDIYATHGLRTGGIGKKSGVSKATHVHCGIDFAVQQEKEKHTNHLRILAAKLARLRNQMEIPDQEPEKLAQMEELLHRLEDEQREASTRISELLGSINADEKAVVEVTGEVVPGTVIEICQATFYVDSSLHRVRFRLDTTGKLVTELL